MKNFWSYIQNDRFAVGCTGQSVYVYNPEGRELARFRGLKYAQCRCSARKSPCSP